MQPVQAPPSPGTAGSVFGRLLDRTSRVAIIEKQTPLMTLYGESTPFLDVSAKLIFGMLPLMAAAWLSDSRFLQMKERLQNINLATTSG